jgi:hypothetical protein
MRGRFVTAVGTLAGGLVVAALLTTPAGGQAPARPAGDQGPARAPRPAKSSSALPRTPDGRPDLQGVYDIAWITPLERPANTPLVLSDDEATKLEGTAAERRARGDAPLRGDRAAPPVGGDGSTGAAGGVGGYNTFWIDPGTRYVTIEGQKRSSLIIDPPDGRVPALTPAAQARVARVQRPTSDETERADPGLETAPGAYDNPERRPLGERCLMGFGSTSGPPALPVLYNNLHQIVQTPQHIMIFNEMVHDARIIRMNSEHLPKDVRRWMGDSIGRWEGDTLVVDTTNFTDKTRFRGSTENLHVVERFTRMDANTLLYRFTVEDPDTWVRPWTGEYIWPATDENIYEYACHEANYALENILRGARQRDAEQAKRQE